MFTPPAPSTPLSAGTPTVPGPAPASQETGGTPRPIQQGAGATPAPWQRVDALWPVVTDSPTKLDGDC